LYRRVPPRRLAGLKGFALSRSLAGRADVAASLGASDLLMAD
jgi:hypothetical protein